MSKPTSEGPPLPAGWEHAKYGRDRHFPGCEG